MEKFRRFLTFEPISRLILAVLMILGEYLFFLFESAGVLRSVAVLLGAIGLFFLVTRRSFAYVLLLTFFLLLTGFYNLSYAESLSQIYLILAVSLLGLLMTFFILGNRATELKNRFLIGLLVLLLGLEMTTVLSFWLISPTSLALLLLIFYYLIWGSLDLAHKEAASRAEYLKYIFVGLVLATMTLITIRS